MGTEQSWIAAEKSLSQLRLIIFFLFTFPHQHHRFFFNINIIACLPAILSFSCALFLLRFKMNYVSYISLQSEVKMQAYATLELCSQIHSHAGCAYLSYFSVLNECVNILNLVLNIALLETINFFFQTFRVCVSFFILSIYIFFFTFVIFHLELLISSRKCCDWERNSTYA